MIKLNEKHPTLTRSYPPLSEAGPTHRLIVPIFSSDAVITPVTRRVWDLAEALEADIKLVGLCTDPTQEPGIRRTLVTMAAMVNYANVTADVEILIRKDWVNAVMSRCQPGDMVVCWDGQQTDMLRKPLSQLLQPNLRVPLYILPAEKAETDSPSNWTSQIVAWIGFISIVIGFLILQIKISGLAHDWTITLEIVSTAVEIWLIWVWNSLFR